MTANLMLFCVLNARSSVFRTCASMRKLAEHFCARLHSQPAKMAAFFLQFLTVALFAHSGWAASVDDSILQPGANGTSVVLLTVAHIQQTMVFADDNGMLRRNAYVETRDGTRPSDNIWRVYRPRRASADPNPGASDTQRQA